MLAPQRIGQYLATDSNGFVVPDVAWSNIQEPWKSVVDFVASELSSLVSIQSVYVRGSVPRGLAIPDVSDIDFLYISDETHENLEESLAKEIKHRFPFVRDLELSRVSHKNLAEVYAPQTRPYFQMLLKTQSLLIAGEDLVKDLRPFRPDKEMVSHVFHLEEEFAELPKWLEEDRVSGKETKTRKWISRRIVRAGLEVTLTRTNRFTRDLALCLEQFQSQYPDHATAMSHVLLNALNGHEDPLNYEPLVRLLVKESSHLT